MVIPFVRFCELTRMDNLRATRVTLITLALDTSAQFRHHDLGLRSEPIATGLIEIERPPRAERRRAPAAAPVPDRPIAETLLLSVSATG